MNYLFKNFFGNWYNHKNQVQEIEIATIKPKNLEDAQKIVDYLAEKIPVVVSFDETDETHIKEILDFVHGKIFAAEGKMEQVGQKVFLFTPDYFEVENADEK